jgi:hypothetical protein
MKKYYWIETAKYWEAGTLMRNSMSAIGRWLRGLVNGRRGRPHPNDKFPFIHVETIGRSWNDTRLFIQRFSWGDVSSRIIIGRNKKVAK